MRRRDFIAILWGMAVTPPKERVSQCPQASTLRTDGQWEVAPNLPQDANRSDVRDGPKADLDGASASGAKRMLG